jgi:hypothetical protein
MVLAASAGQGFAVAAIGILAVLVISAVFYVVGRGEDRQRERDRAAREAPPDDEQPPAAAPVDHAAERLRPLSGSRARRRR